MKRKGGENMRIEFYLKNVYGKTNAYVKDPEIAGIIRTLTGTITISVNDVKALQALGHEVIQVMNPDDAETFLQP